MSQAGGIRPFPIPVVRAEDRIPHGTYCYVPKAGMPFSVTPCAYWKLMSEHPHQMNGWCDYLGTGDMVEKGTSLLWDQVKECGIKADEALEY